MMPGEDFRFLVISLICRSILASLSGGMERLLSQRIKRMPSSLFCLKESPASAAVKRRKIRNCKRVAVRDLKGQSTRKTVNGIRRSKKMGVSKVIVSPS
jgi:hypothetical protein